MNRSFAILAAVLLQFTVISSLDFYVDKEDDMKQFLEVLGSGVKYLKDEKDLEPLRKDLPTNFPYDSFHDRKGLWLLRYGKDEDNYMIFKSINASVDVTEVKTYFSHGWMADEKCAHTVERDEEHDIPQTEKDVYECVNTPSFIHPSPDGWTDAFSCDLHAQPFLSNFTVTAGCPWLIVDKMELTIRINPPDGTTTSIPLEIINITPTRRYRNNGCILNGSFLTVLTVSTIAAAICKKIL